MAGKNLERLMMKREYFPSSIPHPKEVWPILGEYMIFHNMPPLHPMLKKEGFPIHDTEAFIQIVSKALENAALDIEPYSKETAADFTAFSESDLRSGLGKKGLEYSKGPSEKYIILNNLPDNMRWIVKNRKIYSFEDHLDLDRTPRNSWCIPRSISLPDELIAEYGLTISDDDRLMHDIDAPYGYGYENLDSVKEIFLKNLIIELDNYFVRQKYSL